MIAIVDYKAGNLASVKKAFEGCGAECMVTDDPARAATADKIVLPGVGHFSATQWLEETGLRAAIAQAIGRGVPFLGICAGMQWMFEGSTEAPGISGLGLFPGLVERFPPNGLKVPHVGWNTVKVSGDSRLLDDRSDGSFVYYTHSYRAPIGAGTVAITEYGGPFSAMVECGDAFGIQFHPEKSGEAGLRILRSFCEL